ncbi:hypothetical protein [Nocardiopsis coralliicola]
MPRIAVTGHRGLPDAARGQIDAELRTRLASAADPVGLSCLADGADALFARALLDAGGTLEAVVPAAEYRDGLPDEHLRTYDELLRSAAAVHRLPQVRSTAHAHLEAGRFMVDRCDEVVAVWDGRPARGPGGTADIVAYARSAGRPVTVIWPEGARRP